MNLKKLKILLFASILLLIKPAIVSGDEGMWPVFLLQQMDFDHLQKKGLELSKDDIYNINNSSLHNAIVSLNGGSCTGSIISPNGLMLTNHHCSVGQVQSHSSRQNNYLKNGFWAENLDEELANPGMTVSFLSEVIEVTELADSLIDVQLENGADFPNMMKVNRAIREEFSADDGYEVDVHSMFNRNRFFVFKYKTYKDVRLVGVPPESIGNFGGEQDNWQWPRHTADFAIFRVYADPNGEPAEYSPENVPLETNDYLKINHQKHQEGDFAMVLGYPGRTERSTTSYGVEETQKIINPVRSSFRNKKLELMREEMQQNKDFALNYSKDFAIASNFWKMSKGQNEALRMYNVIEMKQEDERNIAESLSSKPDDKRKYIKSLNNIANAYEDKRKLARAINYYNEGILFGPELFKIAVRMRRMETYLVRFSDSPEKIKSAAASLKSSYEDMYDKMKLDVDKSIFISQVGAFKKEIDQNYLHLEAKKILKNDIQNIADSSYQHSIFSSFKSIKNFLDNPDLETLKNDFHYRLTTSLYGHLSSLNRKESKYEDLIKKEKRIIYDILLDHGSEYAKYPDANSTMRLTYGTVGGYSPADAIYYNYYTTPEGIKEKITRDKETYNIPDKLLKLFQQGDFDKYTSDGSQLQLCFLTNLDITGGNSGSPVLNEKGELIGLAFDGNREGLAGDIKYIPDKQKCISTNIGYILFIIDQFADCNHIMNELNF